MNIHNILFFLYLSHETKESLHPFRKLFRKNSVLINTFSKPAESWGNRIQKFKLSCVYKN